MPAARKKLGDILLEMGAVDAQQLRAAMGHQQQWGMPLGQALVERHLCSADAVLRALAVQTGLEVVDLDALELPQALTAALPVKVATMARAVPLEVRGARGEVLVVALAAPASLQAVDLVRAGSGKTRILPRLASDDAIERAIGKLYFGRAPEPRTQAYVPGPPPSSAGVGDAGADRPPEGLLPHEVVVDLGHVPGGAGAEPAAARAPAGSLFDLLADVPHARPTPPPGSLRPAAPPPARPTSPAGTPLPGTPLPGTPLPGTPLPGTLRPTPPVAARPTPPPGTLRPTPPPGTLRPTPPAHAATPAPRPPTAAPAAAATPAPTAAATAAPSTVRAAPAGATPVPPLAAAPLAAAAAARARPVLLFGWSEEMGAALATLLRRAGLEARTVAEDAALLCTEGDVVVTSTLALGMVLGPGQRLRAQVVVVGLPEGADRDEALALGAREYLVPASLPHLVEVIRRSLPPPHA
jgi:hypothetical protein